MSKPTEPDRGVLDAVAQWVAEDRLEAFGHLRAYRMNSVVNYLCEKIREQGPAVRLYAARRQPPGQEAMKPWGSFSNVRDVANRILDGDPDVIGRSVFIVCMDAHCPASMAALFVSLLCLFGDQSPLEKVRVLAVGSSPLSPRFGRLWHGHIPARFELTSESLSGLLWRGVDTTERLGDAIAEDVMLKGTQAIVVDFYPDHERTTLRQRLKHQTQADWMNAVAPRYPPDAELVSDSIWSVLLAESGHKYVPIDGNWKNDTGIYNKPSSLHIVVRNSRMRTIFEPRTTQAMRSRAWLSKEERLELLSWVLDTEVPLQNVFVYHCCQHPCETWSKYVEAGPEITKRDAANRQLWGFLAALCWYQGYHPSTSRAISAFVADGFAAREGVRQLDLQGILDWNEAGDGLVTKMDMPTWMQFQKVLPLVGFDARLANFIVRGNRSAPVLQIKTQLASMLLMGLRGSYVARDYGARRENEPLHDDLIKRGLVWMLLSRFREWGEQNKMRLQFMVANAINSEWLWCHDTGDPILIAQLVAVQITMCARAVLAKLGVDERSARLNADDCTDILRDLLAAFICQITTANPRDKERGIADMVSISRGTRQKDYLDASALSQECKANEGWGVYFEGELTDSDLWETDDWMWIPARLVAEWWKEKGCSSLSETLASTYPRAMNGEDQACRLELMSE